MSEITTEDSLSAMAKVFQHLSPIQSKNMSEITTAESLLLDRREAQGLLDELRTLGVTVKNTNGGIEITPVVCVSNEQRQKIKRLKPVILPLLAEEAMNARNSSRDELLKNANAAANKHYSKRAKVRTEAADWFSGTPPDYNDWRTEFLFQLGCLWCRLQATPTEDHDTQLWLIELASERPTTEKDYRAWSSKVNDAESQLASENKLMAYHWPATEQEIAQAQQPV